MRVILNFTAAQPFVKVKDVIALDPPLSTACQNMSQRQLVEQSVQAGGVQFLRLRRPRPSTCTQEKCAALLRRGHMQHCKISFFFFFEPVFVFVKHD